MTETKPQTKPVEEVLRVEHVAKEFPTKRVLNDINFSVNAGEVMVIMGGSGGGKSTLFKCIIGATPTTAGKVFICGKDISTIKSEMEYNEVRKKYGVLFQNGALFNSLTVGENVALPLRMHTSLDADTIGIIVKMKLEMVGLRDAEDLLPSQISGGMQKRASLARAAALDPKIIFFDEPSAGLDPIVVAVVDDLILDFAKKLGIACVVITHELTSAFRIADKMIMLHKGYVVGAGTPNEIRNSQDPLVRQFIEGNADGPIPKRMSKKDYIEDILEA